MGYYRCRRLRWYGRNGNLHTQGGLIDVKTTTDFAHS